MRMQRFLLPVAVVLGVAILGRDALAQPAATVDPTSHDFMGVTVGVPANTTFSIENTGDADLDVTSIDESGANCGDFAASPSSFTGAAAIPAGESRTVTVTFTPSAAGARACTYTLDSNAAVEPDTFAATGTGVAAAPVMTTSPGSLTFGTVAVGASSAAQMVTIDNTAGTAALNWTAMITAGAPDYNVTPGSGTVPAGDTATVSVTFNPTDHGARPGTLRIAGNDPGNAFDDISLSGTGQAPNMVVTWSGAPSALDFGAVPISAGSNQRFVTIQNTGNASLSVSAFSIVAGGTDFSEAVTTFNVAAGDSVQQAVTFDPSAGFTRVGTLRITGNDPNNGSDDVPLSGTGLIAILDRSPASLTFSNILVGQQSGTQNVTLANDGNTNLSITSLSIDNANFQFVGNGCTGQSCSTGWTITGGGSDTEVFGIRCVPTALGTHTGTLTILGSQDTGANTVALSCTALSPNITAPTPASLAFGDVEVGQTPTQSFSFQNTGNTTLTYSIVLPSGYTVVGPGDTCTSNCSLVHTAGMNTRTVNVRFTPTARQTYNGTIQVNSNDPDTPTRSVSVTGRGIAPVIGNPNPAGLTIAFGAVDVGALSTASTISVQNTGDATLDISSVVLTGGQANQFQISSGPTGASTVAVNGTATWQVRCAPTSIGAKTATFRINSDAINDTTFDFTLTCTGQQAIFTFSPGAGLNFGGVDVGDSATLPVTITNTGNKTGTVSSIVSGNAVYAFTVVGGAPPRTLAASESITVNVTFTPANGNLVSTNLTVMTDGSPASFNIPLVGDGQTQGVDISVADEQDLDVDLGEIRVETTVTKRVTVQNTGDTGYTLSLPSSNDARCTIQLVSPATLPAVIPGGGMATFDVRARPTALGAEDCTITVASDVPTSDTIAFSFVGVAPDVNLVNPANGTLDFVGVDVDAGPMTQTVQVQNTGDFPLTISGCAVAGSARFTVDPDECDVVVEEGASTTIDVLFDPDAQALEAATLRLSVDAFSTDEVQIMLEGVGVDQNITLPALSYTFPDTFRNPDDDDAPVELVVVTNPVNATTGLGAPLTVSMVMANTSAADVFVVEEAGPFTVAPDATLEIPVRFRPTSYGPFTGTLTIMNDTNGAEMVTVDVMGNGVSREVMVSPGLPYDLGTTGVGVPIRLSDFEVGGIRIQNIDPEDRSYRVRELGLVDDDGAPVTTTPFRIVTADAADLGPDAVVTYDVELVAEEAGTFDVNVAIYLDGDPLPHAIVPLTGRAVDVELKGGGGCQASRGGGAGALVLVLGALGLAGRRRRVAAAAAAAGVVAAASAASADPTRNLELSTFTPPPATEVEGFSVESPVVGVSGAWALGLAVSHATDLLTVVSPQVEGMTDTPVKTRTALQLGFAYAFADRFEAGLRVPFYQQSGDMPQFSGLMPADGNALGDVAAHGKARLLDTDALALAASVTVTAPTATADQYAGADSVTGHVRGIGGWRARRAGVTVNAGFLARGTGELGDVAQGNAVTYGAGAWYRALDSMWVIGEAFGSAGLGDGGVQQLEGVVGVRYEVADAVGVSVGMGRGLLDGIGAPGIRGFALFDIAPRARQPAPLVVRVPPPPRDEGDDDGDGVVNADDACPQDAEDVDGFRDDDGCPELDNDEDGLLDASDRCPIEAEDLDGFEDDDGCPDKDNDGDKVLDVDDKCPNEAEDVDGYLDNDGCDDPDNDGDGIPDAIDQCVLEPETINGIQDDDGCPDLGDSLVMVMPDRIEIFEPVTFQGTTAKLTKKSANVLGQVAATMRANRDFKRVRITVHVHPRGAGDDELSEKRAEAVRQWMLQWGVEPERIEAKGLGSSRPLVPKTQKGAAALNDRVEFVILEKEVK